MVPEEEEKVTVIGVFSKRVTIEEVYGVDDGVSHSGEGAPEVCS